MSPAFLIFCLPPGDARCADFHALIALPQLEPVSPDTFRFEGILPVSRLTGSCLEGFDGSFQYG